MEYLIKDIYYTVNKVNCGHETILCCLNNQNIMDINLYELYFISNPNTMCMIPNTNNFGYINLEDVVNNLNININANIKRITNMKNFKKIMIDEIRKNNLILLYVKASMLIYQKIRVVKYPFHMVIANGFNTTDNTIHIIDTFENDDFGISTGEHDLDMDFVLENTIEYCVFEKKSKRKLRINNYDCIKKNIRTSILNNKSALFYNINLYFQFLETIDMENRIESLTAFRWIVSESFFLNLEQYIKNNRSLKCNLEKGEETRNKWNIVIRRYIKSCLKKSNQCLYEKHEIACLISETQNFIKQLYFS